MAHRDATSCDNRASHIDKSESESQTPPMKRPRVEKNTAANRPRLYMTEQEDPPPFFAAGEIILDVQHPGHYAIRHWTEEQWARLPADARPAFAYHTPPRWWVMVPLDAGPEADHSGLAPPGA